MKLKNPAAKAVFICGIVVAILVFIISLMRASNTGDLTNLISGVFGTAIATIVLIGFAEIINLLQRIYDKLK